MSRLKPKDKHAQMKIQQMAFMLIAVTLFFVLAGLFIIAVRFSGLKENAEALDEKNALLLASKVADSPEFSCGNLFGEPRTNCIDTDKIMALKNKIELGEYNGFWGVDGIEIHFIFPGGTKEECSLESYPNCGKISLVKSTSGIGKDNFVSLCRKETGDRGIYDKCELGKIIVIYNEDE